MKDAIEFWMSVTVVVSIIIVAVKLCTPRRSTPETLEYQIECYKEQHSDYDPFLLMAALDGYGKDDELAIEAYSVLFQSYFYSGEKENANLIEDKYRSRVLSCKNKSFADSVLSDLSELKEFGYIKSRYSPPKQILPQTYNDSIIYIAKDKRLSVDKRLEALKALPQSLTKEEAYSAGDACFDLYDYSNAIEYYKQALDGYLDTDSNDKRISVKIIDLCHNIAVSYLWLKKYIPAKYYLDRAQWYIFRRYGMFYSSSYETFNKKTCRYFPTKEANAVIDRHCMLSSRLYIHSFFFEDVSETYKYMSTMTDEFMEYEMYNLESDLARQLKKDDYKDALFYCCNRLHWINKFFMRYQLVYSPYMEYRKANAEIDIETERDEYVLSSYMIQEAAYKHPIPKMDSLLYDLQLFQKDLLVSIHKTVFMRPDYYSGLFLLLSKHDYLEALVTPDYWRRDSLFRQIDHFQELIYSTVDIETADGINSITVDSVRHCLPPDAVAIEFGDFRNLDDFDDFDFSDYKNYYALVLRKDSVYPIYIPLFKDSDVTKNNYSWQVGGKLMTDVIWSAIMPYLNGVKSVCFAPSGCLNMIPIENLPMSDGKCMADLYNVYRVSSTSVIANKRIESKPDVAYIYGGVENKYNKYLEGSRTEAADIAATLKHNGVDVNLYLGGDASDFSLQDIIDARNKIIHIAAHSFNYSKEEAAVSDFYKGHEYVFDLEDPMLRYGIILAPDSIMESMSPFNGIVTASQIANCNFTDCSLLVLSSCGSGLGDIQADGLYGLSRAFRMAGAQTVVMSLWDVSDNATNIFMNAFYNALASGWNKHKAFDTARKTLRDTPGYSNPLYWAAFIMLD